MRLNKIITVVLALMLAVGLSGVRVSAAYDHEYAEMPDYHDYPATAEGYSSYVADYCSWIAYNPMGYMTEASTRFGDIVNDVDSYFTGREHDDSAGSAYDIMNPDRFFSQYYAAGSGSSEGVSGSKTVMKDAAGGMYVTEWEDSTHFKFYYVHANGDVTSLWNVNGLSSSDYTFTYNILPVGDGKVRVILFGNGDVFCDYIWDPGIGSDADSGVTPASAPGNVGGWLSDKLGNRKQVTVKTDPDGNNYLVDDDGNVYEFNPDGSVTINLEGGGDTTNNYYYFMPDPDTLTDDELDKLADALSDYALMMSVTLKNLEKNGCNCADYTDILKAILSQTKKINNNTDQVESLLQKLVNGSSTTEEKEEAFGFFSDSYLKLSDKVPLNKVSDLISKIEAMIYVFNQPRDITFNYQGVNCVLFKASYLDTFSDSIEFIRNLIGIFLLYFWLLNMRKKVTSLL